MLQILYFNVYLAVYSEHSKTEKITLDKNKEKLSNRKLHLIGNNWTIKILYLSFYDTTVKKTMFTGLEKLPASSFFQILKRDFLDLTNFRIVFMILCVHIYKYINMHILRCYKCFKPSRQGRERLEGAQNSLSPELQVVIFTLLKVNLTTKVLSYS